MGFEIHNYPLFWTGVVLLLFSLHQFISAVYCLSRIKKVGVMMNILIAQAWRIDTINQDKGFLNDLNSAFNILPSIESSSIRRMARSLKPLRPIYWLSKESYDILFPETPYDYEP